MRGAVSVAGIVLGLNVTSALACGYCVEDKIAAVYDHAVVTQALDRKHHVVFFSLVGTLMPGTGTQSAIEHTVELTTGVDKGSAKASMASATLAVAFDPQRVSIATLQQSIEKQLVSMRLSLQPLRVIDQYGKLSAVKSNK